MGERTPLEKIASKITGLGVFLALLGLISSVITFIGYELRLLMWIDLWGPGVAWAIRGALIVGGGALAFLAQGFDKSQSPERVAAQQQARAQAWAQLKNHARVQQLLADAARLVRVSWEPPTDADTYQVRQLVWQDAKYQWIDQARGENYGPDHPQVVLVQAYLERGNAPQRLVVTQNLTTRELTQAEANASAWSMMVG